MQNLTQLGHDYVKLDSVLIRLRKNQFQHQVRWAYLIFVIFFTLAKFLENKIYTEKTRILRQNTQ